MTLNTSTSMTCGAAWSSSAARRARMASACSVPVRTSNRHDASTTSIGPRPAVLIQRGPHFGSIDTRRAPPRALEPSGYRRARCNPRGFRPHQLGHAHAGLSGAPHQAGVHVVVEVADLNRLRHPSRLSCMIACLHERPHERALTVHLSLRPAQLAVRRTGRRSSGAVSRRIVMTRHADPRLPELRPGSRSRSRHARRRECRASRRLAGCRRRAASDRGHGPG
jgi:hypothetical protein